MIGVEENLAAVRADHAVFVQRHLPIIMVVTSHSMREWKASERAVEFVVSENYKVVCLRRFQLGAGQSVGQRRRIVWFKSIGREVFTCRARYISLYLHVPIKSLSSVGRTELSWRRRRSRKDYFVRIGVLDFHLAAACTGHVRQDSNHPAKSAAEYKEIVVNTRFPGVGGAPDDQAPSLPEHLVLYDLGLLVAVMGG